jgi:surface-anchored protein
MPTCIRSLLAGASALAPTLALAQVMLPADHVDFGIGFHDGELELHWHVEEPEPDGIEYAPNEAFAFIPLSSTLARPAGAQWTFTGAAQGAPIYVAPATDQTPSVLFLGIGTEEIVSGTFAGDSLTLRLDSVTGPGAFSLWQTDGFGAPTVKLSSTSAIDTFNVTTGGHTHYDWGFTAPGVYELAFTVTGTLAGPGGATLSDSATFTFAVGTPIPEPSAFAALAGLAALGLAATRRRRG